MNTREPDLHVLSTIDAARDWVMNTRRRGHRVGLVPTMGALHEGHLRLVDASRSSCDVTAVTIFVNPTQFGPNEDLDKYPRTLDADLRLLRERGADAVFVPEVSAMYPEGCSTMVQPPRVAEPLEGKLRPGHFQGVCTVVLKLFQILPADVAFFGQKDYQQTLVVRAMVRDLNVPIDVRVCPTVRETDGLAMSSRNQYLGPDERSRAAAIYRGLRAAEQHILSGEASPEAVRESIRQELLAAQFTSIDYISLADPETLAEQSTITRPVVILVSARLGGTRLIDNWIVQ